MSIRTRLACAFAALALWAATSPAHAVLFITTGQSGAQVQLDENHTQHWTYTLNTDVTVEGAEFTMKRGPSTSANITLDLIEGTFADFGTATPLLSVTLGPADFTQSYAPISFLGSAVNLFSGMTYTAILHSDAPDVQSQAYFIKGLTETQLGFPNEGDDDEEIEISQELPPGSSTANPEPATAALGLVGMIALGARRRQQA